MLPDRLHRPTPGCARRQPDPAHKEGVWVVHPHDGRTPWKILRGRVAIVQRLGDEEIDLELLDITSYRSQFKYPHDIKLLPNAGEQWTLNEIGRPQLRQVHGSDSPHRHEYPLPGADRSAGCQQPEPIAGRDQQFLQAVQDLERPHAPTTRQQQIIAGHRTTRSWQSRARRALGRRRRWRAVLARLFARDQRRSGWPSARARTRRRTSSLKASRAASTACTPPAWAGHWVRSRSTRLRPRPMKIYPRMCVPLPTIVTSPPWAAHSRHPAQS